MDAETRHTLAVTDPRAFVRHPFFSSSSESESKSSSWSSSFSSNCGLDSPRKSHFRAFSSFENLPPPILSKGNFFFLANLFYIQDTRVVDGT